ncbi:NADH-quinone oxidoreductase subunit N [Sinimarinibacterium flocculans]|uniref:NADH-quinone oxidoreductase subunit N n=1 Tax=Sinimarinibacterium flocculans TaxID=985250 RepID=A0A318E9F1_9GAMM|nr:proton-conducting transporter membrane subunit [Sinimarinibacterium flocculans]PXV65639.1 NADH dehydrogenase subunit N [Sinimarinibacterium flocculans]
MILTTAQWLAIAPLLVVGAGVAALLLQGCFGRNRTAAATIGLVTLATAALLSAPTADGAVAIPVTPLFMVDHGARLLWMLFCGAGLVVVALLRDYECGARDPADEGVLLVLLAVFGALLLAAANHAASLLLGLELMAVAFYGLIAWPTHSPQRLEAATKYLILSAAASAALLFGLALLYLLAGDAGLDALAPLAVAGSSPLALAGAALLWTGLAFKLALAPFHLWTADVYQGAPLPVTALLATLSKAAVAAVLLRLTAVLPPQGVLWGLLALLAAASMLVGASAALLTRSLKRMLAYSSIANAGYLIVPVLIGGPLGAEAVLFFLFAYVPAGLIAFGALSQISALEGAEADDPAALRGLWQRRPALALGLMLALLSLAGVPLTAGFLGKVYIVATGVDAGTWLLIGALVISSALGLFYYLRIAVLLFQPPDDAASALPHRGVRWSPIPLALSCGLVLWWGILPASLMQEIRTTTQAVAPG